MSSKLKLYLSGPMSNKDNFNFPLFKITAETLRQRYYDIVSPHELPEDHVPGSQVWEWYLKRDLKQMLECDGILLLKDWELSRGARLECYIAHTLNMYVYEMYGAPGSDPETWTTFRVTRYGNQDRIGGLR